MKAPFDTLGSLYGTSTGGLSFYQQDLSTTPNPAPGGGLSAPAPVATGPIVPVAQNLNATVFGHPMTWWLLLAGGAALVYYIVHRTLPESSRSDFATPKIGAGSFLSIGVQAMLFIVLFRYIFTRYQIPGLSALAGAA